MARVCLAARERGARARRQRVGHESGRAHCALLALDGPQPHGSPAEEGTRDWLPRAFAWGLLPSGGWTGILPVTRALL